MSKKGQTTIFIIIAVLIVAIVGLFFLLRNNLGSSRIPSEFEGVYSDFITCAEENLEDGIRIMESHGGYISLPDFVLGSEYMPFSSQLDFLGSSVPYWYYVSGNNIQREQVPIINSMEGDLESFIENQIGKCVPNSALSDGFISFGEPSANIGIKQNEVQMNLEMDLVMTNEDVSTEVSSHRISISSDYGELYRNAIRVYEEEQKTLFLENYTLDIINLYAPVDGVEIMCASKVWDANEIYGDLNEAIEQNLGVVSVKGNSDDYFVVDTLSNKISDNVHVDFLTSSNWPVTFEVNPSQGPLLVANPVGNELGLGALGFCYVTYHFVYDYKYSVMVQIRSETTGEIFQFPVAVIISGSNPRKPLLGEISALSEPEICENANTEFDINILDSNSNPVDAQISFECFSQTCDIGNAEDGFIEGVFPQCVNGFLIAKSEGYSDVQVQLSTVNSGSLTVFMDRIYDVGVSVSLDSQFYGEEALITFENLNGDVSTILYPERDEVRLSPGSYEISVSVYDNVSLEFGSGTQEYCVEVPRTLGGFLGLTKKECYEVEVPEQLFSKALSGGGTGSFTFSEADLRNSGEILLSIESLPKPDSLVQIQQNYLLFENREVEVSLR
jgi:hypothetical protein